MREAAREIATLAVARAKQGGHLKVRQREQLRRALARVAEARGWGSMAASAPDPVRNAAKDGARLTQKGTAALATELTDELAQKKTEMSRLERAAKAIRKMADDSKAPYPTEVSYSHTARDSSESLITKTEELTLNDADEAQEAAQTIERRMETWGKLREQMIAELKQRQKQLEEMKRDLATFVESTEGLLHEVLATLH